MDFRHSERCQGYVDRVRAFVRDVIRPVEMQYFGELLARGGGGSDWTKWTVSPAVEALKDRAHYFQRAGEMLKERGWIEDAVFKDGEVIVKGSIEVSPSDIPTCHRLRGILREFYERFKGSRVKCTEEMCASTGSPECHFRIEEM